MPIGGIVRRNTAVAGAKLYVTGTIGDAALGLKLRLDEGLAAQVGLSDAERDFLLDRYLLPQPRVCAADAMRDYAVAAMDISDGLVADLGHMCRTSKVSARVVLEDVPTSSAGFTMISKNKDFLETAISGGDDYEILAAVMPENCAAFEAALAATGLAVTQIGDLQALGAGQGQGTVDLFWQDEPFNLRGAAGFRHF